MGTWTWVSVTVCPANLRPQIASPGVRWSTSSPGLLVGMPCSSFGKEMFSLNEEAIVKMEEKKRLTWKIFGKWDWHDLVSSWDMGKKSRMILEYVTWSPECIMVPYTEMVNLAAGGKRGGRSCEYVWIRPLDEVQFPTELTGTWKRKWQPTPICLSGESHGWRSLVGYSPQGRKESNTTEQLHFHFHFGKCRAGLNSAQVQKWYGPNRSRRY